MYATCGNLGQHGCCKISHVSEPFNLVHGSVKMPTVTFSHWFAIEILLFYAVQDYLGYGRVSLRAIFFWHDSAYRKIVSHLYVH